MRNWFLTFCFLPVFLCAHEGLYYSERIGNSFYSLKEESPDPVVTVSGEFIYMTQSLGWLPKKPSFSPGFRVFLERKGFFKSLDFGVFYTHWETENEKVFRIPILNRTRTITNTESLHDLEFVALKSVSFLRFFAGVECLWQDHQMSVNQRWNVSNDYRSWGPLIGTSLEWKLHRFLSVKGTVSCSYLVVNAERVINKTVNFEEGFKSPKSKFVLALEGRVPLGKKERFLRLGAGYEVQYFWSQGIDRQFEWDKPLSLQGVTAQLSLDY